MWEDDYMEEEKTSLLQEIVDVFGIYAISFSWIYFCIHYYGPVW